MHHFSAGQLWISCHELAWSNCSDQPLEDLSNASDVPCWKLKNYSYIVVQPIFLSPDIELIQVNEGSILNHTADTFLNSSWDINLPLFQYFECFDGRKANYFLYTLKGSQEFPIFMFKNFLTSLIAICGWFVYFFVCLSQEIKKINSTI